MKRSKLISTALSLLLVLSTSIIGNANNISTYAVENILSGKNRYLTAVEVSKRWNRVDKVVLVNSNSIVDALSVTPYAKLIDAPILLTEKENLNSITKEALIDLGVNEVHIIGSEGVISDNVVNQIKSMGMLTHRIGGKNRHDTALNIANKINKIRPVTKVAVVNGYKGLADAVSIASVAASEGMAIIPASLNKGIDDFKGFISLNSISKSYIIGSTGVISKEIEKQLPNPERLGGINRIETNAKVINKFYTSNELNNVFVSKQGIPKEDQLIDALSVGVLAAKENSPVLIVGNSLSSSQRDIFRSKKAKTITQVGSGGNENAFNELKRLQDSSNNIPNLPVGEKIMYVTNLEEGKSVNVRNKPSTMGQVVGKLYRGNKVEVISIDSAGWVKIKFNNEEAYVSGSYLSNKNPEDTTETIKIKYVKSEGGLNVRKGPSTGDEIIGRLGYKDKVEQLEMFATGWVKIKYNGSFGYVSNDYLSENPIK